MKYRSKKDPDIVAAFDFEDEKCHTTRMIYLTGPKAGYSFTVSNSTLSRYWEQVKEVPTPLDFSTEELVQINTPYAPKVTPHYIPKPQSVIEYEDNKHHAKLNKDLPDFEALVEMFGYLLAKVNEKSTYIRFKDGTTLHRKVADIRLYTVENVWEALTEKGFTSKANNDKDRPFAFVIKTKEEFETMSEVLINTLNTKNKED